MVPLQIVVGRSKPNCLLTGLSSTYPKWGPENTWSEKPLAYWKISFPGSVFVERYGVGPEGERSLSLEETLLHTFYYCKRVRPFWNHIRVDGLYQSQTAWCWLHCGQCWPSISRWEACTILAVVRIMIWMTQKKGLYEGANFFHRHLIMFFRHQLQVKIRCHRKHLGCITFEKKMGVCSKPGHMKEGNIGVILPSSSCAWRRWSGSIRTPLLVSRNFCAHFFPS